VNILISGGSKGLGLDICHKLLLNKTNRIIAFARNSNDDVENLMEQNQRFSFYEFDLSNLDNIKDFVKKVKKDFGPIECLINNAAIGSDGILATMHDNDIKNAITINSLAPIILTKYCVKNMLLLKHGKIINISSIVANTGFNGLSVYAATKSSQIGFTKSLARELGKVNINVNAILPGFMETEMTSSIKNNNLQKILRRSPMNKLPDISSISNMVEYLISENANDITGQSFVIDAGATC